VKKYLPRYIDNELKQISQSSVMAIIDGVKGCGKTKTAERICKSSITIDITQETEIMLQNDPDIILEGEKPRLIDE
jgi:hypothetical protein